MTDQPLTLESFTNECLIACGSFGKVYLVRNQAKTVYAMKRLNKAKIVMTRQVQHLQQEIAILRQCSCPFITKLVASFQDAIYVYMIMEFVPGGELFYHLRHYEHFPPEVVRFYGAELCVALGYLHDQLHTIYRDLKPENVLLDRKGHVKLADFGFAKQTEQLTFTLLGTPEYIAPELIRQTGHHRSADWWSFGIILYELAVGWPHFYNNDVNQLYMSILEDPVEYPDGMDPALEDLISKLLVTDKDKRLGANVTFGTAQVQAHPFFEQVDWGQIEQKLVKPYVVPVIDEEEALKFWEYAVKEVVADEDEILELLEIGGYAEVPEDMGPLYEWV